MYRDVRSTPVYRWVSVAAALMATAACGDGPGTPTVPDTPVFTSIALDRSSLTFEDIGQSDRIHATARDQDGNAMTGVPFTWVSSDPSIATVSGDGLVTTTGLGSAQITVSSGNRSVRADVAVPVAVKSIALERAFLSFEHIGQHDTLRASVLDQAARPMAGVAITWTSSDPSVIAVDESGAVTTLGFGNAHITASAAPKSASAFVTVATAGPDSTICTGGGPTVVLLVEAQLRSAIKSLLTRFAQDICADGYRVWLAEWVPNSPPGIRAYLRDAWHRSSGQLAGAILIGDIPHAYQTVVLHSANPDIPETNEEAISFQYYADLDGTFSTSPGYASVHPYSFDVHGGDLDWELWIGVLPTYKGSTTATIDALMRYFDRNHAYRTGGPAPPRAFIQVSEHFNATTAAEHDLFLAAMRNGVYSWTPFSSAASAHLYFNSPSAGLNVEQGYAALQAGAGDFFVQDAHGFYGAGGKLTIARVETDPVKTIFYWSNGCAIGDLDHADNFLTSVVYSPTSSVLVAKGTTNNSGGMGNNQDGFFGHNVARAMAAGATFGDALLGHVNVPLVFPWSNDREFHFGTPIMIGDPTLKLRS